MLTDSQNSIVTSDFPTSSTTTSSSVDATITSSDSAEQLHEEVPESEEDGETEQTTSTDSTTNGESSSEETNTNSEKAVDWEIEDRGTYILLKKYTGPATDLVVPNEINGKPTKLLDIDLNVIPNLRSLSSFTVRPNQKGQKVGLETTSLADAFSFGLNLNQKLASIDLSGLDTSNVTDMSNMFFSCLSLRNLNLGDLDTSNVTDMSNMFCFNNLTSLDLGSNFDTSNVTNMKQMFTWNFLENINLGDKFDTSNVLDMENMFALTPYLKSLDLGDKFNTRYVGNMSRMFAMSGLEFLNLGDKFVTIGLTKMEDMFANNLIDSIKQHLNFNDEFDTSLIDSTEESVYPSTLLLITKDYQLLNMYDYSKDGRTPVVKPYLDANGGLFEDSQSIKNYFKVANTPEHCSLEGVQEFLTTHKPTKENYRFKQWEASPKEPTNLEELLNTIYTATWQDDSIIDSNIPSQDQDNVVTRPLTDYGIAYVPKQLTFASTSLEDNGEQVIPFTKIESFHIGIRDVRNTASSWTLSAQLEWTGQTLSGAEILTTNATGVVKKNTNNGVDDFDASKDFTDCPTSEVIGQRNVTIQSTSPTPILIAPSGTHNAVYDYDLGNVALRIPETRQIEPAAYHGNVHWFLNNTL
ncbi:BspA family leucine-rich repeat surface protein [Enterococcus faecalis]|uniref:BspA family leucine-rich repeat surface protein n=1 Tax=Enterococcus faecalis TaxID=1351 RepID=UPI001A97C452|nr:BspA family leucine-rich repeat surface protein [Enterococcus faecalis]